MTALFYVSAAVAVASTLMVVTRRNAVHALLYAVTSFLGLSLCMFALGAPFVAALEVIVYAGAIMVLFVFVVMMLNLGAASAQQESRWLKAGMWIGPGLLSAVLLAVLIPVLPSLSAVGAGVIEPSAVGALLFGPYLLAVELTAVLLLAGLVAAYHLGRALPGEAE